MNFLCQHKNSSQLSNFVYEESFGTFVLSFYKNAKQAVTVKTINVQDFYHSLSFLAKVKIYYTLCVLEGDFLCTFNKVYNVSHPILSTGDSSRRASCQSRRLSQNWSAQFLTTRPAFFWCVRGVPWDGGLFRRRSIFFATLLIEPRRVCPLHCRQCVNGTGIMAN